MKTCTKSVTTLPSRQICGALYHQHGGYE